MRPSDQSSPDFAGRQAVNAIFGDRVVGSRTPDILVQFQYGVSDSDIAKAVTGDGVVNATNAVARIAAGGTSTGTAQATSRRSLRYHPGFDGYALFTAGFEGGGVGASHEIGLIDDLNGFAVGTVDGVYGVTVRYNGTDTFIAVNPDDVFKGFDPTKINIYRINYGWLGVAPDHFEVHGGHQRGWITVHVYDIAGASSLPTIVQPVQAIRGKSVRASGSGEVVIKSCSWSAGRIAEHYDMSPADRYGALDNTKSGITTETNILTLTNKATFQSLNNRVTAHLDYFSISCEGTKPSTFRFRKGSTLGGTPAFTDYGTQDSVVEYDTAGTTVSGGKNELIITLDKAGSERGYIRDLGIKLQPGESLTVTAESASSTEVVVALRWHEEF